MSYIQSYISHVFVCIHHPVSSRPESLSGRVSWGSTGRRTQTSWWCSSALGSLGLATSTWASTVDWSSRHWLTGSIWLLRKHSPCTWAGPRQVLLGLGRLRRWRIWRRPWDCYVWSPTVGRGWTIRWSRAAWTIANRVCTHVVYGLFMYVGMYVYTIAPHFQGAQFSRLLKHCTKPISLI